jgi:hypothetical protein
LSGIYDVMNSFDMMADGDGRAPGPAPFLI